MTPSPLTHRHCHRFLSIGIMLLAGLLMSACTQTPAKPSQTLLKSPPAWYLSPPKDTQLDLYGVGAGKDRNTALQAALNDLASKLGVQVSSQYQLQHKSYNSAFQFDEETTDQKIRTEVATTTLNQYQLVKTEQIAYDRYFAMVKTDKPSLALATRRKLEQQLSEYLDQQPHYQKLQGLQKYLAFWQEQQKLPRFRRQLALLTTLNARTDTRAFEHYLRTVTQHTQQARQQTLFYLTATDEQAQALIPSLESQLTAAGFKVSVQKSDASDQVTLATESKKTEAYGFTVLRSQLTLTLTTPDNKKNIIGRNQFSLKGQGLNPEQAKINLIQSFKKKVSTSSFEDIFGLSKTRQSTAQ